jgi:hypothetical protein
MHRALHVMSQPVPNNYREAGLNPAPLPDLGSLHNTLAVWFVYIEPQGDVTQAAAAPT